MNHGRGLFLFLELFVFHRNLLAHPYAPSLLLSLIPLGHLDPTEFQWRSALAQTHHSEIHSKDAIFVFHLDTLVQIIRNVSLRLLRLQDIRHALDFFELLLLVEVLEIIHCEVGCTLEGLQIGQNHLSPRKLWFACVHRFPLFRLELIRPNK
jgi:hypothetical protein